jgi:pilus assembly protein Flp/PilA
MRSIFDKLLQFGREEEGPTAVEYAVMLAMIILVCFAAIAVVGTTASTKFSNVALTTAISTSGS